MTEHDCFEALKNGAILLTPNRRLSASLTEQFHRQQSDAYWPTPAILPLNAFLSELYQSLSLTLDTPLPILLNEHQVQNQWIDIIAKADEGLLNQAATAKAALDAWRLCQQWLIEWPEDALEASPDQMAYQQWAETFAQQLDATGAIDHSQILHHLTQHAAQLSLPSQLIFAGFHEFTPSLNRWQDSLTHTDCLRFDYQLTTDKKSRLSFRDSQTEMKTMAAWAKQQLDSGLEKIACVVPNLQQCRQQIQRVFMDELGDATLIDISAGKALSEYPLIHSAMMVLSLNPFINPLATWRSLLQSPFLIGSESEFIARADCVADLHDKKEFMLKREQVMAMTEACPIFCAHVTALFELKKPEKQAPSVWARYFSDCLLAIGWPGERDLNSFEYQVLQRFLACLDELASLDLIYESVESAHASRLLSQILKATVFQPQSKKAAIQILGMLEAAGSRFEAIWVMGLDDETWPARAKPNPFIPYPIQRQLKLPHANAERELEFSQAIMRQFQHSTDELIVSYARSDGDRELAMSRLLSAFPEKTLVLETADDLITRMQKKSDLSPFEDDMGPSISAHETIRGGSFIYKLQAACPFQAFATFRLGAEGLQRPHNGFDALERGIMLHRAMELFWQEIPDQTSLLALSPEALEKTVGKHIDKATRSAKYKRPNSISDALLDLEKQRMQMIILQWLTLEKNRPPFRVAALEKKVDVTVAGLTVSTRIDRIDETADGQTLIVDYKTGQTNPSHWFGERMDEPQLPLYAISQSEVDALVFASLRCDQIEMKGVSQDELDLPGVKSIEKIRVHEKEANWTAQVNQWQTSLANMATAFQQGEASVSPKSSMSCAHCELKGFCRIGG